MRLKLTKPVPLAVILAIVAVLTLGATAFLLTRQSSSAQTVSLPNVSASDFASANITATAADLNKEHPKASADQAKAVATGGDVTVSVLAANLIKMTFPGHASAPQLAWAVSLDPATAPIPPILGDCGLNNDCTPAPETTTKFAVVFVDANTGAFMFGWNESAPGSSSISLTP